MLPIINFKICDNSEDCEVIKKCRRGVFGWDAKHKTLTVNPKKCGGGCDGECVNYCPVKAIRFCRDKEDCKRIEREIERDPRTMTELFIDRYGAMPVDDAFVFELTPERLKKRINVQRPMIIEFNRRDTTACLLKSVPIADIQEQYHPDAAYAKFFIKPEEMQQYGVTKTPCLRFYYNNELLGQIDEYFEKDYKYTYLDQIYKFGRKIK
jgi:NAD-dependent dihydropyrimidine dehydrogenase PreA subunit